MNNPENARCNFQIPKPNNREYYDNNAQYHNEPLLEPQIDQKFSTEDKQQDLWAKTSQVKQAENQANDAAKKMMSRSFRSSHQNIYNRQSQNGFIKDGIMINEYFNRVARTGYGRNTWGGFYRR